MSDLNLKYKYKGLQKQHLELCAISQNRRGSFDFKTAKSYPVGLKKCFSKAVYNFLYSRRWIRDGPSQPHDNVDKYSNYISIDHNDLHQVMKLFFCRLDEGRLVSSQIEIEVSLPFNMATSMDLRNIFIKVSVVESVE